MNVTGGGTKLLFCEGEPDSLDRSLLNRVLIGKSPSGVIVASGGKQRLRAFIDGRLSVYRDEPEYIAFRDRDFDVEPPDNVSLIPLPGGKAIFLSHRTAIENYLLDAKLIHRYWQENARSGPRWQHGDSPGEGDIGSWIVAAAMQVSSYQAVRWALASLRPAGRWPEIGSTWTRGSGYLPSSLNAAECLDEATSLVRSYQEQTRAASEESFLLNYRRFVNQFSFPEFVTRGDYMIWYHGKDIQKSMQKLRPNSISLQHYFKWAVERLDWEKHADILELAGKI